MRIEFATPQWHYDQANALIEDVVAHKDDDEFTEVSANLLFNAARAHSLQGLLAANILEHRP